eukprot:456253_1
MCSPFVKSPRLPISVNYLIPKPSYHPTDKNCIVISTDYEEQQIISGIHKYNMVTNESQIIHEYDDTLKPEEHGQFIDPSNNTLLIYGGIYNTFKTFDLNTNQMKLEQYKNTLCECNRRSRVTFIPPPINQIHVLNYECEHFIFDITNKQTTKVGTDVDLQSHHIRNPKLLFIEPCKTIFIFGADYNDTIFEYNNNTCKWNINK